MAENGKVIHLFEAKHGQHQVVDPQLTSLVGMLRDRFHFAGERPDVIVKPPVEGAYEAFVQPNGAIRVGAEGVKDFENLFGTLGVDRLRVPTLGLYVVYTAFLDGIRQATKQDDQKHTSMLDLAQRVRQRHRDFMSQNIHDVEFAISGWYASKQARQTVAAIARTESIDGRMTKLNSTRKSLLDTQILSSAFEARRSHRFDGTDTEGRKRVLGHFAISMNSMQDSLERKITQIFTDTSY